MFCQEPIVIAPGLAHREKLISIPLWIFSFVILVILFLSNFSFSSRAKPERVVTITFLLQRLQCNNYNKRKFVFLSPSLLYFGLFSKPLSCLKLGFWGRKFKNSPNLYEYVLANSFRCHIKLPPRASSNSLNLANGKWQMANGIYHLNQPHYICLILDTHGRWNVTIIGKQNR